MVKLIVLFVGVLGLDIFVLGNYIIFKLSDDLNVKSEDEFIV